MNLAALSDAAERLLAEQEITPEAFAALPAPHLPCGFLTVEFPDGSHKTFRVRLEKSGLFAGKRSLSLLIGPVNTDDFEMVGTVGADGFDLFKRFKNTKVAEHTGKLWRLAAGEVIDGHTLMESRRCRWCMRDLTDPESVRTQLGPTCRKRLLGA